MGSIQTATTGQLANASRIAIAELRFTAEHNSPMLQLVEHMRLRDGEKSVTVPKAGQMVASDLTDGVDLADNQDIGMTTVSLTSGEVGLKTILTNKLLREQVHDTFKMVGRQMGEAMGRKKDTDLLSLFSTLNSGSDLGATNRQLDFGNLLVIIAHARANKFPRPTSIVHHPNALFTTVHSGAIGIAGGGTMGAGPSITVTEHSEGLLRDFWRFKYDGIDVYDDGNISEDSSGDGIGAIFSKQAMVYLESVGYDFDTEEDKSLRATELIAISDYGVFELDDTYGAPVKMDIRGEETD